MENQYCRVGSITPNLDGRQAATLLEHHYQNLMEKADQLKAMNDKLGEFFENKALQVKQIAENLVP